MAVNDNESEEALPVNYAEDEEPESGIFRWMSAFVVLLAVAGFFGLAWYAYKSGGEAIDEKDVELIKADNAPVKEAPANPGGMQIPNQDKTVYNLINNNKNEKPVAERILPAPETPMDRGSDTQTWMSDKVKNKAGEQEANTASFVDGNAAKPQEIIPAPNPGGSETLHPVQDPPTAAAPMPAKVVSDDTQEAIPPSATTSTITADKSAPAKPATPPAAPFTPPPAAGKPTVAPAPQTHEEEEEPSQAPAKTENAKKDKTQPVAEASGEAAPRGAHVQLGAYKSESEAKNNWAKISHKFAHELGGKQHYIVRADLGHKGVYYRLQIAPFSSGGDAEQFCVAFVSEGQGCFLAKGK